MNVVAQSLNFQDILISVLNMFISLFSFGYLDSNFDKLSPSWKKDRNRKY